MDVSKAYDTGNLKVKALRGIDLKVRRSEMVSIMGPSGCGKTSLINTLSGLDIIDDGLVEIDGRDLASMNDRQRTSCRAVNMGFVFQLKVSLLPGWVR